MNSAQLLGQREFLRPLGAFEQLMHGYMRARPFQHSLVAHLSAELTVQQLVDGLALVAEAHPLLASSVGDGVGPGEPPVFLRSGRAIGVRVAHREPWEGVVAAEQNSQIDDSVGPLVRAVLIPGTGRSTLVLTFAHQGVDGVGALQVLNDLVVALNGGRPVRQPAPPAQEDALADVVVEEPARRAADEAADGHHHDESPSSDPRMRKILSVQPVRLPAVVSTGVLDPESTTALARIAHENNATVQGALTVAAARALFATGRDFVRVAIPMDLRRAVNLPPVVANRFLGTVVGASVERYDDLWGAAREVSRQLRSARSIRALQGVGERMSAGAPYPPATAESAIIAALSADIELSNLGVVDLPEPGPVGVTAIDGPFLATHISGQQVIGVNTSNGRLRLAAVSHEPVPDLLEAITDDLRAAIRI